jgi:hypothetical protein
MTASADQMKYFKLSADDLALIKELEKKIVASLD